MKISVIGNNTTYTPALKPFCHCNNGFSFVNNNEDADVYLYIFSNETFKNEQYEKEYKVFRKQYSREVHSKTIIYLNCDDPSFISKFYNDGPLFFVAQPTPELLNLQNVITIPLIRSNSSIFYDSRYRNNYKDKDFIFIGNTDTHENRKVLATKNIHMVDTGEFYSFGNQHKKIYKFLDDISRSKFGLAPRGKGTSSFRLYEYLMVGTVPIITDMVGYPFENEVNWDDFSIRGTIDDIDELIERAKNMNEETYLTMRYNGIRFFDEYCRSYKLYSKLIDIIREKFNV